jgi:hypothetical protein
VHGTGVYSAGVDPKDPALERFLDIKKKKKKYLQPTTMCFQGRSLSTIKDAEYLLFSGVTS